MHTNFCAWLNFKTFKLLHLIFINIPKSTKLSPVVFTIKKSKRHKKELVGFVRVYAYQQKMGNIFVLYEEYFHDYNKMVSPQGSSWHSWIF